MDANNYQDINSKIERIAKALEVMAGTPVHKEQDWQTSDKYIWNSSYKCFRPVKSGLRAPPESLLVGIEEQIKALHDNTKQFAAGYSANNALLWGARGMGKSASVKAIHQTINEKNETPVIMIEIARTDLQDMPVILEMLWEADDQRFILFCDDLSFEQDDTTYKSLKAILEGGIEGSPPHVLFYATSNRRHLMPKNHEGGSQEDVMRLQEDNQEQISISDRFGLWIGFHSCTQDQYLDMIDRYIDAYDLPIEQKEAHSEALLWAKTRGSRSGRVAWQFIKDLAGRLNVSVY